MKRLLKNLFKNSKQERTTTIAFFVKVEDRYLTTQEIIEALCQCVNDREEIVAESACDTLDRW